MYAGGQGRAEAASWRKGMGSKEITGVSQVRSSGRMCKVLEVERASEGNRKKPVSLEWGIERWRREGRRGGWGRWRDHLPGGTSWPEDGGGQQRVLRKGIPGVFNRTFGGGGIRG